MRFTVSKHDLLSVLVTTGAIVEKSSNIAEMCLTVTATFGDAAIAISGTSRSVTGTNRVSAGIEAGGSLLLDAANLRNVVKALPDGMIDFSEGENLRVNVKAGKSKYVLNGVDPTTAIPAPPLETAPPVIVDAAVLRKILDRSSFAIAPDDNRYGLNGLKLEIANSDEGQQLRAIASDGNRLSWAQGPCSGTGAIPRRMLLPNKGVRHLRAMIADADGPVRIAFGDRACVATCGNASLHMRLMEAEFPNYKEVIPTTFKRRAVVNRAAFLDSLKRVEVFCDTQHSVRIAFTSDGATLSTRKLDAGDAREELEIATFEGDPITMGFNIVFLREALIAATEDAVQLRFGNELSPVLVCGQTGEPLDHIDESGVSIVMPVRLD